MLVYRVIIATIAEDNEISSILLLKHRFYKIGFMAYNGFTIEYWNYESRLFSNPPPSYYASDALLKKGLLIHYFKPFLRTIIIRMLKWLLLIPKLCRNIATVITRLSLSMNLLRSFI
jgi:hypothetical protein